MSRRCMVTGKGVMTGNNVSHANNKTRRTFGPNVQSKTVYSETLGRKIRLRVSTAGLKTIEHNGGIDAWLVSVAPSKLPAALRPVRSAIETALAKQGKKTFAGAKPVKKKASKRLAKKNSAAKKTVASKKK